MSHGEGGDALGVLAGRLVLGVDGARQRAEPDQRLGALELVGALGDRELADDLGVVDPCRVAAVGLAPVQRAVGSRTSVSGSPACSRPQTPARDGDRSPPPSSRAAIAPRARSMAASACVLVGLGHEQRELVAAQAGEDVLGAGDVAQRGGDRREHGVAALVAERVVDRLEVVDVEQRQRQRPARGAARARAPRAGARGRRGGWPGASADRSPPARRARRGPRCWPPPAR